MTITIIAITSAFVVCFAVASYVVTRKQMHKSYLHHMSSLEAAGRSKEYHEAGNEMYKKALDSYKEGQQFWSAATEALLDAKRRERKVDDMVDHLKAQGVVPFDFNAGEEAA